MTGTFPVPEGDPAELRALASVFRRLAGQHEELRSAFLRHAQQAEEGWTGGFADRFRECAEVIGRRFGPLCEAAMEASAELTGYASALEAARDTIDGLNRQASDIGAYRADPALMSQLGQQAAGELEWVRGAAASCAARLAGVRVALAAALPDTSPVAELLAEVRRASADLKKNDPGAWQQIFGPDGLIRQWNERLRSPLDVLGADLIVAHFIQQAEDGEENVIEAREFAKNLPAVVEKAFYERFGDAIQRLRSGELTETELAGELREVRDDMNWAAKANTAFQRGGEAEAEVGRLARGTGGGLAGLALLGDGYTVWKPLDAGAAGNVDRGVAVANAAAAGIDIAEAAEVNFAIDWIPGVGEAVGIGTGLYLAGDWAYHTFKPFRDVCNDVGHATVSVAKDTWHAITSIF
jgi:hypothetical protein